MLKYSAVIADYYYLEALKFELESKDDGSRKFEKLRYDVSEALDKLTPALANSMYDYLAIASCGEARHATDSRCARDFYIAEFVSQDHSRDAAYKIALHYDPKYFLPLLIRLFNAKWKTSGSIGGGKWALVAKAALMYHDPLYAKRKDAYVDYAINVEHNGGNAFNKEEANRVLDIYVGNLNLKRFLDWKAGVTHILYAAPLKLSHYNDQLYWLPSRRVCTFLTRFYNIVQRDSPFEVNNISMADAEDTDWNYRPAKWGSKKVHLCSKPWAYGPTGVLQTDKLLNLVLSKHAYTLCHKKCYIYPQGSEYVDVDLWEKNAKKSLTRKYRETVYRRLLHLKDTNPKAYARRRKAIVAKYDGILQEFAKNITDRANELRRQVWFYRNRETMRQMWDEYAEEAIAIAKEGNFTEETREYVIEQNAIAAKAIAEKFVIPPEFGSDEIGIQHMCQANFKSFTRSWEDAKYMHGIEQADLHRSRVRADVERMVNKLAMVCEKRDYLDSDVLSYKASYAISHRILSDPSVPSMEARKSLAKLASNIPYEITRRRYDWKASEFERKMGEIKQVVEEEVSR